VAGGLVRVPPDETVLLRVVDQLCVSLLHEPESPFRQLLKHRLLFLPLSGVVRPAAAGRRIGLG